VLVARTDDAGTVTLDFPRPVLSQITPPGGLREALGVEAEEVYDTGSLGDILAVFDSERTVRGIRPDFDGLADLQARTSRPDRGVIVTAPADTATRGYDFVSRFFTPGAGIPEDPVTGSAHTALAPYWSARLDRRDLTGLQVSRRSGTVMTHTKHDRVELTGKAITVSEGNLLHDPS
jgi:PhzF family phenazine biosynthesis protein